MARPRKPTNVLDLSGAFKHNPQRLAARANEPKPDGPIGDAPAWMAEDEAEVWREIVSEAPPGVLTNADRGLLGIMATLRVLLCTRQADAKDKALLLRCYTELGMTPASRSKVQAKPSDEKPINAFAAI